MPFLANKYWVIGSVALVDVSTPTFPVSIAMIDVADLPLVIDGRGRWHATHIRGTTYSRRKSSPMLHQQILPGAVKVDHRNSDGLDNRKRNLRPATTAQNGFNRRPQANASGFKGVHPSYGKWRARIKAMGRVLSLGTFSSPVEAARAYDAAARQYFGTFAHTNFQEN